MERKTIPQLEPIELLEGHELFPVDDGIQTYSVSLQMIADMVLPPGVPIPSISPDVPNGFISCDSKMIGNEGSGAHYEGEKYRRLYRIIWSIPGLSTVPGEPFTIESGKGMSADEDFDSMKRIMVNFSSNELFIRQIGSSKIAGKFYGDTIRNITGQFGGGRNINQPNIGVTQTILPNYNYGSAWGSGNDGARISFDASRVVPTSDENRPKSVGLFYIMRY